MTIHISVIRGVRMRVSVFSYLSDLLTLSDELIVAIDTTQRQDRRRIADVFEEIERNRLRDRNVLGKGLTTLAVRTEDQLVRTRNDMAKLLVHTNTDGSCEPETKE